MSQIEQTTRSRVGVLQIGILLLTLITASAHLYLASQPDEELRFWFLLNGLGYLTLLVAFVLPQLTRVHHRVRSVLLGYTLLTIVLWFFLGSPRDGWPWD